MKSAALAAMAYWYYRWDWGEAIAFDGVLLTSESLSWPLGFALVDAELDAWVTHGRRSRFGPCNTLLSRSSEIGNERSLSLLLGIAENLADSPRSQDGALTVDGNRHLYVDSLYDTPVFLWKLGELFDRTDFRAASLELALGHTELLQDPVSGLMRHHVTPDTTDEPGVHWGRGNGWAALGLSDLLRAIPEAVPERTEIATRYRRLIDSLVAWQASGGMWRNIIDDLASFPEASTTAMIETAITQSVRSGDLDGSAMHAADSAWEQFKDRIDPSGHFAGVSFRPGINTDPARYEHVPTVGVYPWGNGSFLRSAAQRTEHSD